jgi:hypothetical protein
MILVAWKIDHDQSSRLMRNLGIRGIFVRPDLAHYFV